MKKSFLIALLMLFVGQINAAVGDANATRFISDVMTAPDIGMFDEVDMLSCDECDFRSGSINVTDISECRKGFTTTGFGITSPCEIVGYSWDFGDTGTGTGSAVVHEYSSSGTYEVCVTTTYIDAEGNECSDVICRTIDVEGCVDACEECRFDPGTIVVTDISECRKGFSTTGSSITSPCEIVGYSWDFGDMETGTGSAVSHEYDESGTYEVCVTIRYINGAGEECSETICTTVEAEACADPCDDCEFDPGTIVVTDISECRKGFSTTGSSITFPCEITGYSWDFGDMETGTGSAVSHEYDESGTYEVCVTITYINVFGEECSETICTTVEAEACADPCDDCEFDPGTIVVTDISECRKGFTTTGSSITSPCEIVGYSWDFGNMETGTGSAVSHEYDESGTYEVCVTIRYINVFGEECSETICTTVEAEACADPCDDCRFDPGRIVVTDISECRKGFSTTGSSITFPCEITGYSWDFGDMETGTGSAVSHEYDESGTYEVCVTITYINVFGEECSETICTTVEAEACPDACDDCRFDPGRIVVTDISNCRKGFSTTASSITSPCEVVRYNWDFGDMSTGTGSFISHIYDEDGTYEVCVTITYLNAFGEECSETICTIVEVEGCADAMMIRGSESPDTQVGQIGDNLKMSAVPNPADDEVTITVFDPTGTVENEQLSLVIFDLNGREVYRSLINMGIAERIDVSQLQSGMYLYEVRNAEMTLQRQKLIIK